MLPFLATAVSGVAKKAVASKLGQGLAKTVKPGQAAEGLAPEEFQTDVTDGKSPDLSTPGSAQSVVKGLPDMLAGAAGSFDAAKQRSQSRLDALPSSEEIAARGPISRILSNYGG